MNSSAYFVVLIVFWYPSAGSRRLTPKADD